MPASDISDGPLFRLVHARDANPAPICLTPSEIAYFAPERDPARRLLRTRVRSALRVWLGERLGLLALQVPLQTASMGRLELGSPYQDWSVSVSTRRELGLIAVNEPGQGVVGVDIEWLDPAFDFSALGAPGLTPAERAALETTPAPTRLAAFFRLWTRKEAVAKALSLGVAAFDAGLDLSALSPAESSHWQTLHLLGHSCRVRDLPVSPGYVAALAIVLA
jgi:4'-phosphopantetheinyl transferase